MSPSAVYTYRSLCSPARGRPGTTLNQPGPPCKSAPPPPPGGAGRRRHSRTAGDTLKPIAPTRGGKPPGGPW
jgi:hypothetical protein